MENIGTIQPADGCHLFFVDDEAVLFHESQQKLFRLNTTAAVVWSLLDRLRNTADIAAELQSSLALTEDQAVRYLRQARNLLDACGVLKGQAPRAHAETPKTIVHHDAVDYRHATFVAERRYGLLSSRVRVRFTAMAQLALVEPVLRHLQDATSSDPTVTLDIVDRSGDRIDLCRDGEIMLSCDTLEQLAPLAKSLLWTEAINAHAFFLDIHAGVVGDGRQCYLFPGAQGSGKSTLTAFLIRHGFEYFSDEVALLHADGFLVEPVPLALCVKNAGVEVLSGIYPQLGGLAVHRRDDGKRVRYLPPPPGSLPAEKTRRPVAAIIFPRYAPDGTTAIEVMGNLQALQVLMRECLVVSNRLNARNVAAFIDWIEQTPTYRLKISNLEEAAYLVKNLADAIR